MSGQFNLQAVMRQFQAFQSDPMGFLMQRGLNIPPEFNGNPQGAVQYLMDSGKMNQQTYNQLKQMAGSMQRGK